MRGYVKNSLPLRDRWSTQACQADPSLPRLQPAEPKSANMLSIITTVIHRFLQNVSQKHVLFSSVLALCLLSDAFGIGDVIWAVNCGGETHTDIHGVRYQADPLEVGFASDYGKNLIIQRVVPQDQVLYQTERYHLSTFSYDIPVWKDGDYVLGMKFSEVWFTSPNQKVFDVVLNGEHTVVSELDIFAKVGRGVAHDEIVPFSIKGGKLRVNGETSQVDGKKISLEFVKGDLDNPKVNAIYVIKGTLEESVEQHQHNYKKKVRIVEEGDNDIPKLAPLAGGEVPVEEEEDDDDESQNNKPSKQRRPSGPRAKDPYAGDDTSTMLLPVFVAIGAFIPLLFCLCKL